MYMDSGATSQKPQMVLDELARYYSQSTSHVIMPPMHELSGEACEAFRDARTKVARFVNARDSREIVFTRNATEGINLVANSWGLSNLKPGDEVVLSVMEHHSNIVPWQMVAERTGCTLKFIRLTEDEQLDMHHARELVGPRTKLIAVTHVSNTLGCVNPVDEIVQLAQSVGARVLLDACQSVPHMPMDVQALGVDFVVGSSHKMCGPSGIGFLWAKLDLLEAMPPYQGGGEMIQEVHLEGFTPLPPPARFEAGTPAMAEAIGLGAACDYLMRLGMDNVHAYERQLGDYLYTELAKVEGVRIFGPPPSAPRGRAALCAFHVNGVSPKDVSNLMDQSGVAIRAGSHCTQPLHRVLGVETSARASLYIYNTKDEVDTFVARLKHILAYELSHRSS